MPPSLKYYEEIKEVVRIFLRSDSKPLKSFVYKRIHVLGNMLIRAFDYTSDLGYLLPLQVEGNSIYT